MQRFLCCLVALGMLGSEAGKATAESSYVYTTIDPPGSWATNAWGINDSGQIVGVYVIDGVGHGFLLNQGVYTTIDVPGTHTTWAYGINNAGQIVGTYFDPVHNVPSQGFLLSGGTLTTLDVPGATFTQPFGISNSGQIVGISGSGSFLFGAGVFSMLNAVDAFEINSSFDINSSGQVVGGNGTGFLLSDGRITTFTVPGSTRTEALGINDAAQIVGDYSDAAGVGHGFVLSGGAYTTLNVPDSRSTVATRINNVGQIVGYYADSQDIIHGFLATPVTTFAWHGPGMITTGVTGNPSLVQAVPGTYGTVGNYELVVPLQSGGMAHFYRNNDDPSLPWNGPYTFATDQGAVAAVSLIQSNFSSAGNGPGNLAVVARIGAQLAYYYREDVTFTWQGPFLITTGVSGVPSFVQARPGSYGTKGNYELVAPLQSGGIAHFYRNNDDPNLPWVQTATFGADLGAVDAVSIVQSTFSTAGNGPGNLAVVARVGSNLVYFYRDDTGSFAWHGPTAITTGVTGTPSFVQAKPGTYGNVGNYELAVPLVSGGLAHFYRNNDDPSLPWTQTATLGTDLGLVDAVGLIQSNFSTTGSGPGNLAAVTLSGGQLDYFYRDD